MNTIANVLWMILAGIWLAIAWFIVGVVWCVTIVGIPLGRQCFKIARLALAPFGAEVVYGGGTPSLILNVLWIIFGGVELAVVGIVCGLVLCITIVGIPAGLQSFKFAKLALLPFGAEIRS